jgi:hypothetical protein
MSWPGSLCQICDTHYHNWSNFALWSLIYWCRVWSKKVQVLFRVLLRADMELSLGGRRAKGPFSTHTHTHAGVCKLTLFRTPRYRILFRSFCLWAQTDDARVICASAVGNWLGASCWLDDSSFRSRSNICFGALGALLDVKNEQL